MSPTWLLCESKHGSSPNSLWVSGLQENVAPQQYEYKTNFHFKMVMKDLNTLDLHFNIHPLIWYVQLHGSLSIQLAFSEWCWES